MPPLDPSKIPTEKLPMLQQFQIELQALMAKYPNVSLDIVHTIQARDNSMQPEPMPTSPVKKTPLSKLWPKKRK